MNIVTVIICSLGIFITIIVSIIYSLIHQINESTYVSFEQLYSHKKYHKFFIDSANAGKENSPFLENDIIETIDNGSKIIDSVGNLFEGVECNDSKPEW